MAPLFSASAVTVRVPASSANLGPGFDALGLALDRCDDVTARVAPAGLSVSVDGQGSDFVDRGEKHLIVRSMRATFDRLGGQPAGLALQCVNRIPQSRGLGSSAAAIVAGVELARAMVAGGSDLIDRAAALELASEIEGHPDNVAACMLGGLTVAWTTDGASQATRVDPVGIRPVLFISTDESGTEAARAALPASVPHSDAVFNASRAALLIVAMTGRSDLLMTATEDRLHQEYRYAGMPASAALVKVLRGVGVAAVISGAGSSVLALASSDAVVETARGVVPRGWECAELGISDGVRTTAD
jgi:homoserine kinase